MIKITGKQEILTDLKKRVDDKILEQSNFDLLKKLIENADTLDEAIKIAELGTTYKRTGFHFDKRLEKQSNTISYFKKNNELSFVTDKNAITHKLIVGDNYPALLNLLIEYKGKIDVIYIDPPYGKDSMGEFAETNYDNAITRDNLLSMLYPRLMVAKQLLSDSGVIFCSIDDRNQAYVKCLFDEVFEESNYVETFVWNKTSTPPALSKKSRKTHEYILCYLKNSNSEKFIGLINEGGDAPLLNESNKEIVLLFTANSVNTNLKNGTYEKGDKKRVELLDDVVVENGKIVNDFRLKGRFRWVQNTLNEEISNNTFLIVKSEDFAIRYCREGERTVAPANFLTDRLIYSTEINKKENEVETNEQGGKELIEILGNKIFDFPKPVSLIKYLISFKEDENKNFIILDFFAGSGTTGQAVLELNKEDGGQRQFILATSNEITDTTPNGVVKDVTSKRLKRVMTGKCYDGTSDFEWTKKNKPLGGNLLVLDIAEVSNFEAVKGKTPFDVIDETLYGNEKFATVKEKVEWVCNNFEVTQKRLEE